MDLQKQTSFSVAPAKVEDVRRLVDIEFHAFENERVNQLLSFRDYKKPAHFERSISIYEEDLKAEESSRVEIRRDSHQFHRRPNPSTSLKKVVKPETSEIISFAKIEFKSYTAEELGSPYDTGHEEEPQMNRDWFGLNERLRRQYVGMDEHCYIAMLATAPKHQHKGAGTMLLEEILEEADAAGVEVYLEGTNTAKPFYEKHGFEPITELRFNPGDYGVEGIGIERQTVMVRGALGRDAVRQNVRPFQVAKAHANALMQIHDCTSSSDESSSI